MTMTEYFHLLTDENYIQDKIRQISRYDKDDLVFGKIVSEQEMKQLGKFRLKNYNQKKTYMLKVLNQDGLDTHDYQSKIYAAWLNNEMIASIRLCHSTFESSHYLPDA